MPVTSHPHITFVDHSSAELKRRIDRGVSFFTHLYGQKPSLVLVSKSAAQGELPRYLEFKVDSTRLLVEREMYIGCPPAELLPEVEA